MAVALTMVDEAEDGRAVGARRSPAALGCPVVAVDGRRRRGIAELRADDRPAPRRGELRRRAAAAADLALAAHRPSSPSTWSGVRAALPARVAAVAGAMALWAL